MLSSNPNSIWDANNEVFNLSDQIWEILTLWWTSALIFWRISKSDQKTESDDFPFEAQRFAAADRATKRFAVKYSVRMIMNEYIYIVMSYSSNSKVLLKASITFSPSSSLTWRVACCFWISALVSLFLQKDFTMLSWPSCGTFGNMEELTLQNSWRTQPTVSHVPGRVHISGVKRDVVRLFQLPRVMVWIFENR